MAWLRSRRAVGDFSLRRQEQSTWLGRRTSGAKSGLPAGTDLRTHASALRFVYDTVCEVLKLDKHQMFRTNTSTVNFTASVLSNADAAADLIFTWCRSSQLPLFSPAVIAAQTEGAVSGQKCGRRFVLPSRWQMCIS